MSRQRRHTIGIVDSAEIIDVGVGTGYPGRCLWDSGHGYQLSGLVGKISTYSTCRHVRKSATSRYRLTGNEFKQRYRAAVVNAYSNIKTVGRTCEVACREMDVRSCHTVAIHGQARWICCSWCSDMLDADNSLLVNGVAISTSSSTRLTSVVGVQDGQGEVVVEIASPAPVDME